MQHPLPALPGQKNAAGRPERPHILLCAPSNAAVDELARRLLKEGLVVNSSQWKMRNKQCRMLARLSYQLKEVQSKAQQKLNAVSSNYPSKLWSRDFSPQSHDFCHQSHDLCITCQWLCVKLVKTLTTYMKSWGFSYHLGRGGWPIIFLSLVCKLWRKCKQLVISLHATNLNIILCFDGFWLLLAFSLFCCCLLILTGGYRYFPSMPYSVFPGLHLSIFAVQIHTVPKCRYGKDEHVLVKISVCLQGMI